jgi:orotate phosphoribosyltransferase
MLWSCGAVKVSLETPFRLTSGAVSPIYVNCRALLSSAPGMDIVTSALHWVVASGEISADVVAGGVTAGVPFAAYLSSRLALPMAYVRTRAQAHGLGGTLEGM